MKSENIIITALMAILTAVAVAASTTIGIVLGVDFLDEYWLVDTKITRIVAIIAIILCIFNTLATTIAVLTLAKRN